MVSTKQGKVGRNGDEQVKGFVPIRTQGLFDRGGRCDMHVVHAEVGDWIGQAEHVPFDETMCGNDCTRMFVSISQALSADLDGSKLAGVSERTYQSI